MSNSFDLSRNHYPPEDFNEMQVGYMFVSGVACEYNYYNLFSVTQLWKE